MKKILIIILFSLIVLLGVAKVSDFIEPIRITNQATNEKLMFDGTYWINTGTLIFSDDDPLYFGTGSDASILYETADANAKVLMFLMDESDDSGNNIPAFVFSEETNALNVNLGLLDGIVEAAVVVLNNAGDAYVALDAGDVNGTEHGLYFNPAADEDVTLIKIGVTGTPIIHWDETNDAFESSKGWNITGATDVNGAFTATSFNGLSITAAANTFLLAQGTGSLDVAAGKTINFDMDFTVDGTGTTITGVTQANTITLNESFTVGGGFNVSLTATGAAGSVLLDKQTFEVEGEGTATQLTKIVNANNAAATLTIEGTSSVVNQDVTTDATVRFGKVEIDGATDYLDVSTDFDIVSAADMVFTPSGTEVHIVGGLSVGDETDVGDNNLKVVGTSLLEGNTTFTTAGVVVSAADGVMTFLGAGDGNDLNLIWDYDNHATATTIGVSSGAATVIDFGTIGLTTTGGLITGDITISDADPVLNFKDTSCDDADVNAFIQVDATATGTGAENIDMTFMYQVAGTPTNWLIADGDGNTTMTSVLDIHFSATGGDVISNDDFHVGQDDAAENIYIHDSGIQYFYDASDDTSVTLQISGDGTTILDLTGTLDITATLEAEHIVSTDDADINDNLTVGDIIVDEASGVISHTGATLFTLTSVADIEITTTSNNEDIKLTPHGTGDIILDGHFNFNATAIASLTDNNTTWTAYAGKNITIESVTFDGGAVGGVTDITISNDILLSTGGVISWNATDLMTHSTNTMTLSGFTTYDMGAVATVDFDGATSFTSAVGGFTIDGNLTLDKANSNPILYLKRTDTSVASGQEVGSVRFQGGEDGSETDVGSIKVIAMEDWGAATSGTDMSFATTPTGATSDTERMRIYSTGAVDVIGAFTAGTIASDGNVAGTTGTFTSAFTITPSTAVIGLFIDQDNAEYGLEIDADGGQYAIYSHGKYPILLRQDVSDGIGLSVQRNIDDAESNPLVVFLNDHATDTFPTLSLQNDGSGVHITTGGTNENLEIDPNGTGDVIITGDADVTVAFTAGSIASDGVVSGTTITASVGFALGDGDYIGITGNEIITFNAAGSINITGASFDVDGAATATSYTSDGHVTATTDLISGDDVILPATGKVSFDGATPTTYQLESTDDIFDTYVGGVQIQTMTEATADYITNHVGTVYTPSSDQARANDSAITIDNTIVRVVGDGAAVVLDTDPAIEDGASDGQFIIIQGTSDANTVEIADAVNTALDGGQAFTLGDGDTITLIWDSGMSLWLEIGRSNN